MNANSCIFCCGFRLDTSSVHLPGGWRKHKCNKKLPVRKVINVIAMLGCDVRASRGGPSVVPDEAFSWAFMSACKNTEITLDVIDQESSCLVWLFIFISV